MKVFRLALLPLSAVYGLIVAARNAFFDLGILPSRRAGVPVISVGNISAGGTGKSPLVLYLAEGLKGRRRVAVLSRGYGRTGTGTVIVSDGRNVLAGVDEGGDEPVLLARSLPGVAVVVDERRTRGAKVAVDTCRADTVLLDDGFQHRYLARDLDLVLLTADEVLQGEYLLPTGRRREPLGSLARAGMVIITGCDGLPEFQIAKEILGKKFSGPIGGMGLQFRALRRADGPDVLDAGGAHGKTAVAFSGIGSPGSFDKTLRNVPPTVVEHVVFPDHHWYTTGDLDRIAERWKTKSASFILTTGKDAERLRRPSTAAFLRDRPVYVVETDVRFLGGEQELWAMIDKALGT